MTPVLRLNVHLVVEKVVPNYYLKIENNNLKI